MARTAPYINTGLDDSKVVLKYPKDPIKIGKKVIDGNLQDVWLDPKDLIRTPEQNHELAQNIKGVSFEASRERAMWEIAAQADAWLARCMQALCPCADKGQAEIVAWANAQNINYIEDNSDPVRPRFILRRGDVVLSEICFAFSDCVKT